MPSPKRSDTRGTRPDARGRRPVAPTVAPPPRHAPERMGTAPVRRSGTAGRRYDVAGSYTPDPDPVPHDMTDHADGPNPYGRGAAYDAHGPSPRATAARAAYATLRRAAADQRRDRARATAARCAAADVARGTVTAPMGAHVSQGAVTVAARHDAHTAALQSLMVATAPVPTGDTPPTFGRPRVRRRETGDTP